MWEGYSNSLKEYANEMLKEIKTREKVKTPMRPLRFGKVIYPNWLGNEKFHSSHRAALLKKNQSHYKNLTGKKNLR